MREINDRNVVRDLEKRRKTRVKRRKGKGGKRIGKRKLSSFGRLLHILAAVISLLQKPLLGMCVIYITSE